MGIIWAICYKVYTVTLISVSWKTSSMMLCTLGHCSPSKPQPIRGIDKLIIPWLTQCPFIATKDDSKVLYVGLWKYFSLVTYRKRGWNKSLRYNTGNEKLLNFRNFNWFKIIYYQVVHISLSSFEDCHTSWFLSWKKK